MKQEDGLVEDLAILVGLLIAGIAIWWLAGNYVILFATAASAAVSLPAAWLGDALGATSLPGISDWLLRPSQNARDMFLGSSSGQDLLDDAYAICVAGGRNAAGLIAVFSIRSALAVLGYRPDKAYRTRHDLDSMIAEQARVWPTADRPAQLDPSLDSEAETAVNAMSVQERITELRGRIYSARPPSPETGSILLCEQLPLITQPPLGRPLKPDEWLDARALRAHDGEVDIGSVEAALAGQLTRSWTGSRELRAHEKAFTACLGKFAVDGPDLAGALIDTLSRGFASCREPGDCQRVLDADKVLASRIETALETCESALLKLAAGHFWVETALVEIWRSGRLGGGVLAPARFLWLKPEDRAIWYAVQGIGGNPVVEAAGIRAHHLAERQYGFPCPTPHVLHAARALVEIYLDRDPDRLKGRKARGEMQDSTVADRIDNHLAGLA